MAIELVCGQCQGRFLAEIPGSVVMCPHCSAHLQTPGAEHWPPGTLEGTSVSEPAVPMPPPPAVPTGDPSAWNPPPALFPADSGGPPPNSLFADDSPDFLAPGADGGEDTMFADFDFDKKSAAAEAGSSDPPPEPEAFGGTGSNAPPPKPETFGGEAWSSPEPAPPTVAAAWESAPAPDASFPDFSLPPDDATLGAATSLPSEQTQSPPPVEFEATQLLEAPPTQVTPTAPAPAATSPLLPSTGPVEPPPSTPRSEPVAGKETDKGKPADTAPSSTLNLLLASYASAMTLVCLYLLWQLYRAPSSYNPNLESLPDVKPAVNTKNQKASLPYWPGNAMNPGHTLRLGESQRYGSVRVTPLRVVRETAEKEYFDPKKGLPYTLTGPLLKLFVRFENVSTDQEFAPLDSQLVFTREPVPRRHGQYKANQFVSTVAGKGNLSQRVSMYELMVDGDWSFKGQQLGRELKPGESYETYLATIDEGLEELKGDLVWRVHFRKGYNRESGRGVTTLIEVVFNSSEIVDRTAPAVSPPATGTSTSTAAIPPTAAPPPPAGKKA